MRLASTHRPGDRGNCGLVFGLLLLAALLLRAPATIAQIDSGKEWEKRVAAAEKEGEISIYGQSRAGVGKYMITSLPQYDDITALHQLVNEILGDAKKKG